MHNYFCTNADCKRLLTDFELNRLTYNKSGSVRGSKFKFCRKCRSSQQFVSRLRCVGCRETFNPVTVNVYGNNSGSNYKIFCSDCKLESDRRRARAHYNEQNKNPEFGKERNRKSKIRRLQKKGRLPADMEVAQ